MGGGGDEKEREGEGRRRECSQCWFTCPCYLVANFTLSCSSFMDNTACIHVHLKTFS